MNDDLKKNGLKRFLPTCRETRGNSVSSSNSSNGFKEFISIRKQEEGNSSFNFWLGKKEELKAIMKSLSSFEQLDLCIKSEGLVYPEIVDEANNVMRINSDHSYASKVVDEDCRISNEDIEAVKRVAYNDLHESRVSGGLKEDSFFTLETENTDDIAERKKQWKKINIEHMYTKKFNEEDGVNLMKKDTGRTLVPKVKSLKKIFIRKITDRDSGSRDVGFIEKRRLCRMSNKLNNRKSSIKNLETKFNLKKDRLASDDLVKKILKFSPKELKIEDKIGKERVECNSDVEKDSLNNNINLKCQIDDCLDNKSLIEYIKEENNENFCSFNLLNNSCCINEPCIFMKKTESVPIFAGSDDKVHDNSSNLVINKRPLLLSSILLDHSYTFMPVNSVYQTKLYCYSGDGKTRMKTINEKTKMKKKLYVCRRNHDRKLIHKPCIDLFKSKIFCKKLEISSNRKNSLSRKETKKNLYNTENNLSSVNESDNNGDSKILACNNDNCKDNIKQSVTYKEKAVLSSMSSKKKLLSLVKRNRPSFNGIEDLQKVSENPGALKKTKDQNPIFCPNPIKSIKNVLDNSEKNYHDSNKKVKQCEEDEKMLLDVSGDGFKPEHQSKRHSNRIKVRIDYNEDNLSQFTADNVNKSSRNTSPNISDGGDKKLKSVKNRKTHCKNMKKYNKTDEESERLTPVIHLLLAHLKSIDRNSEIVNHCALEQDKNKNLTASANGVNCLENVNNLIDNPTENQVNGITVDTINDSSLTFIGDKNVKKCSKIPKARLGCATVEELNSKRHSERIRVEHNYNEDNYWKTLWSSLDTRSDLTHKCNENPALCSSEHPPSDVSKEDLTEKSKRLCPLNCIVKLPNIYDCIRKNDLTERKISNLLNKNLTSRMSLSRSSTKYGPNSAAILLKSDELASADLNKVANIKSTCISNYSSTLSDHICRDSNLEDRNKSLIVFLKSLNCGLNIDSLKRLEPVKSVVHTNDKNIKNKTPVILLDDLNEQVKFLSNFNLLPVWSRVGKNLKTKKKKKRLCRLKMNYKE